MIQIHYITIDNFGPVKYFSEEVRPLTLFIGPQASGKSTISKLIYYFRSIKDDLFKTILEAENTENPHADFIRDLRSKFLGIFGTTKHMRRFKITYKYDTNISIVLTLKQGYVYIEFSYELKHLIDNIFDKVKVLRKNINSKESLLDSWNFIYWNAYQKKVTEEFRNEINLVFNDDRTPIYIPAGRSLVATLSDQLQNIGPWSTDLLMKEFIDRINHLKKNFSKPFEEIIDDRKKLTSERIDFSDTYFSIDLIRNIMKGKYIFSSDGERIYFNENEYTKLLFASSGQQEVVWILLLIFTVILERNSVYMVIEEPEAHLYPTAQFDMVSLIALLLNKSDNNITITTHSPYILSSLNVFLYASKTAKALDKSKEQIVDRRLRIQRSRVNAFSLLNSKDGFAYSNIIDEDMKLVKAETIDDASIVINNIIDKLIEMEDN